MPRKGHTEEQILHALRQAEGGEKAAEICRKFGLNARIKKAGGKIYLTPALTTHYHPVKSFSGLLKYAFKTSRWHIFTLRENKAALNSRHLAPAVFLILLLLLFPASFMSVYARAFLAAIMCVYVLTGFYFSLRTSARDNLVVALVQPFASFCFHVAYGSGTLFGLTYLFRHPSTKPKPIRPGLPVQPRKSNADPSGVSKRRFSRAAIPFHRAAVGDKESAGRV